MKEYIYVASPAEIKAWHTLYNWPIINWRCNWWIKVVESKPLGEEYKTQEHPFKKFK